jgi:hypothetical protein
MAALRFGAMQRFSFALPGAPDELTVFRDGRAIVKGTEEAGTARSVLFEGGGIAGMV